MIPFEEEETNVAIYHRLTAQKMFEIMQYMSTDREADKACNSCRVMIDYLATLAKKKRTAYNNGRLSIEYNLAGGDQELWVHSNALPQTAKELFSLVNNLAVEARLTPVQKREMVDMYADAKSRAEEVDDDGDHPESV